MLTTVRLASQQGQATLRAWDIPQIIHGFMTRQGGVSVGRYASFNLAGWVGDDAEAVRTNWTRWEKSYPAMRLARLQQVHGNQVHIARHDCGKVEIGDGLVTAVERIALAVFTADCVPVLMADAEHKIVAALHAGWRGVLADIASAGVSAMIKLGGQPSRIRAALGPSIGPCCFEVDSKLAELFVQQVPSASPRPVRPGKMYLDLRGILRSQLKRAGLLEERITNVGPCTRCANEQFFSRRAAGGSMTGLQMSFVAIASGASS
jgi:polyphenol oxidase